GRSPLALDSRRAPVSSGPCTSVPVRQRLSRTWLPSAAARSAPAQAGRIDPAGGPCWSRVCRQRQTGSAKIPVDLSPFPLPRGLVHLVPACLAQGRSNELGANDVLAQGAVVDDVEVRVRGLAVRPTRRRRCNWI